MRPFIRTTPTIAVLALTVATGAAMADQVGTFPAPIATSSDIVRSFPAIFGAASAFSAPGGTGYVSLSYSNPRAGLSGNAADGDISAGYTLGNPINGVSVSFGVNVTSLTDSFGDSGSFNISASRMLRLGGNSATFFGVSAGSLHGWGDAANDEEAFSAYVSHLVGFDAVGGDIPVQFTLGYGNRTTLSSDGTGNLGEGVFAGVGVGVTENLSLSVSGTETQLNLGATATIPQVPGLSVTAGVYDATENVQRQQFNLSVAFSF